MIQYMYMYVYVHDTSCNAVQVATQGSLCLHLSSGEGSKSRNIVSYCFGSEGDENQMGTSHGKKNTKACGNILNMLKCHHVNQLDKKLSMQVASWMNHFQLLYAYICYFHNHYPTHHITT